MKKFEPGQRVVDEYLGAGEVTRPIRSSLDSKVYAAYRGLFDTPPPVGYNMGGNPTMVFPGSLTLEDRDSATHLHIQGK